MQSNEDINGCISISSDVLRAEAQARPAQGLGLGLAKLDLVLAQFDAREGGGLLLLLQMVVEGKGQVTFAAAHVHHLQRVVGGGQ